MSVEALLLRTAALEEEARKLSALLNAERDRAEMASEKLLALQERHAFATDELERLRKSYALLQQECELLRRKIFHAKAERIDSQQLELELAETKAKLDDVRKKIEEAAEASGEGPLPPPRGPKQPPTGRRNLEASELPVERIEIADPLMEELVGRGEAEVVDAVESSLLKHRRASMIRLVVARKIYRLVKSEGGDTTLVEAAAPTTIIERSIGTPSLFANIATEKFDRAMPLYRQEERFGLLGTPIDRGTMSRWMDELGGTLGATILHAMKVEALATAMCLSTDATGILVQQGRDPTSKARRACKKGHYFVQIADRDGVFFEFTEKETSAAVRDMFKGFTGYVQADAKNVYDILFREPAAPPDEPDGEDQYRTEVGCWAHARRYFFEAAAVGKEPVAREALYRIRRLFETDARFWPQRGENIPPAKRKALRDQFLRPEIDLFFDFVRGEYEKVKNQRGLLRSALAYAKNQEEALKGFLGHGNLKMDNNASERALRRVAIGRKNWLFVGSDDHAQTTANLLSMIASAKLHDLDPEEYLRDIFRVLPHWPKERYLELGPKTWIATRARLDPNELEAELGPLTVPPPNPQ